MGILICWCVFILACQAVMSAVRAEEGRGKKKEMSRLCVPLWPRAGEKRVGRIFGWSRVVNVNWMGKH